MKEILAKAYRFTYWSKAKPQKERTMLGIAFFFGIFGIHRLLMGYKLWWLMFLTMGGMGIWSLLDVWRLYTHQLPMADGTPLR